MLIPRRQFLSLPALAGATLGQRTSGEVRGVWLHPESMFDADPVKGRSQVRASMERLAGAGFNLILPWIVSDYLVACESALYRQAQLALREVIGTRELDALLADREAVASELVGTLRARVERLGLHVDTVGIRDLILPGEMKELLNKVTEARKAAEAALITRREETAAMRSQANTARIFESNPTLMRLKELEVLERVAASAKLEVVLSEPGLANRITKLL